MVNPFLLGVALALLMCSGVSSAFWLLMTPQSRKTFPLDIPLQLAVTALFAVSALRWPAF